MKHQSYSFSQIELFLAVYTGTLIITFNHLLVSEKLVILIMNTARLSVMSSKTTLLTHPIVTVLRAYLTALLNSRLAIHH